MTIEKRSQAGRPKSNEKKQQILKAASCLFLRQGFIATSMDNVAKEANVSKQTVYSHFKNKDTLFTATIIMKCSEYRLDEEHIMNCQNGINGVLLLIGEQFVSLLHDSEVISMYRVVMGEVSANIHVAELFFEAGPRQAMQILVNYLSKQQELPINEEHLQYLSMIFFNMLKGDYHMPSLMGLPDKLTKQQQMQFVASIVTDYQVILQSYSNRS